MDVNSYDSLAMAVNGLKKRGYTHEFNLEGEKVCSAETKECVEPEDLTIMEFHRFEGASDPDDMAVVYAVESKTGSKGIIVDAFGTYASRRLSDFIKRIKHVEHGDTGGDTATKQS